MPIEKVNSIRGITGDLENIRASAPKDMERNKTAYTGWTVYAAFYCRANEVLRRGAHAGIIWYGHRRRKKARE